MTEEEHARRETRGSSTLVWEVFRQERKGAALEHAGSVAAPNAAFARAYAHEQYGRRGESVRLWVVPRAAIIAVDEPDWLQPPFDHSYRVPAGYPSVEKLRAAKARGPARAHPAEATP